MIRETGTRHRQPKFVEPRSTPIVNHHGDFDRRNVRVRPAVARRGIPVELPLPRSCTLEFRTAGGVVVR